MVATKTKAKKRETKFRFKNDKFYDLYRKANDLTLDSLNLTPHAHILYNPTPVEI